MTSNWQALPSYQPQNTECDWLYGHWPFAFEMKNEKKKNSTNVKLNLAISTNIPFILHSLNDDSLLIHIRIHSQYMSSEFVQKRS